MKNTVTRWLMIASAGCVIVAGPALAAPGGDMPPAGAALCSGCHGAASMPSAVPSLQGQSAQSINTAMLAFKTGARPATLMNRIATGFSNEEIDAIAQWLAKEGKP